MNKPCPHCRGKVIPHVKKNKELLHVCVECGVIIARRKLSSGATVSQPFENTPPCPLSTGGGGVLKYPSEIFN